MVKQRELVLLKGLIVTFLCLSFKLVLCENLFGDPPFCLLNRVDVIPCELQNPQNTAVPGDNEYGIYTTRIRSNGNSLRCDIRRRNHVIRPIDTIGGDPRILYIFSPGRALADPIQYGNQYLVDYRITCPPGDVAFFDLTSIDMEDAVCIDPNFNQPRCIDYVQISRRGGQFGFTENCGSAVLPENRLQLDSGNINVRLRTSDRGRFPGFRATVTCVQIQSDDDDEDDNRRRRKRSIIQFNDLVERHKGYIRRMRRAAVSFDSNYCPLRLEEINVPIGAGVIYRDKVVSIIDIITMQEIRRLRAPINRLTTLDNNGNQNVFFREAPLTNASSPTILPGPGPLAVTGTIVFFTTFAAIPELGDIPPEVLMPDPEESTVLEELLEAHFEQVLECDNEILPDEDLNAPPIDLVELGLAESPTTTNPPSGFPFRSNLVSARRTKRAAQELVPTPCNYTDQILTTAILNQAATNPVLATVVDVIMNCTEIMQPGRIEVLIETIELEFQFCQDAYSIGEDDGSVEVCVEVLTNGSLPRSVELNVFTQDGSATVFEDYNPVNETLLFPNGTMRNGNGSQICIEVQIVDDDVIELTKSFIITANSPDPNVNSSLITTTVFILDDEPVTFEFAKVYTTAEDQSVQLSINLTEGFLPFDVNVTLTSISEASGLLSNATDGMDYTLLDSVVTFPAGSSPGMELFADVSITNDTFLEFPLEVFFIQGSLSPVGQFSLVGQQEQPGNIATVFILDDDIPVFQFTQRTYFVEESNTTLTITLQLIDSILTLPVTVVIVDLPQQELPPDGDRIVIGDPPPDEPIGIVSPATVGQDYIGFLVNLTFPAGSEPGTNVSTNITIIDDTLEEGVEIITVLAFVDLTGGFSGILSAAAILVTDNDFGALVAFSMIEIFQGTTANVTCQSNRDDQGIPVFVVSCNLDNDPSQDMTSLCTYPSFSFSVENLPLGPHFLVASFEDGLGETFSDVVPFVL